MSIRLLENNDYYKGYLELLGQLTPTHNATFSEFCDRLNKMKIHNPNADIYVIEYNDKIVATGKILIEMKMHNNFTNMGHIEDVVVDSGVRGKGFGKMLMEHLQNCGKNEGCYKIILDCSAYNTKFYEKCGFKIKGSEMVIYF